MEKSKQKIIGIGWDVAGWRESGSKHGFAVLEWDRERKELNWPKETQTHKNPTHFSIKDEQKPTTNYIYERVTGKKRIDADAKIIIAIDAPLGFPVDFCRLVNRDLEEFQKFKELSSNIDNDLGYRKTEQHIHKTLGKRPLSAPFQEFGNNATVAITHMWQWEKNCKFKTHPFSGECPNDDRIIIEVYPALIKGKEWEKFLDEIKISGLEFKSIKDKEKRKEISIDAYDAALCAIMAVAYGLDLENAGRVEDHPMGLKAVKPEGLSETEKRKEGWIYYFLRKEEEKK